MSWGRKSNSRRPNSRKLNERRSIESRDVTKSVCRSASYVTQFSSFLSLILSLVTVTSLVSGEVVSASTPKLGIPVDPGTLIEIGAFDLESQTYEITEVENSGQGPWYSTREQLAYAIPTIKMDKIQKDPESIVSAQYKTDKLLLVIPQDVVDILKKKSADSAVKK